MGLKLGMGNSEKLCMGYMGPKRKRYFLFGYLVLSLLFLLDFLAIQYWKLSMAGYWSDRILFWAWLVATFFFIPIYWKSIFTKLYLGLLMAGLSLSIMAMLIPFFGIVYASTGFERLEHCTPETGRYRLQIIQSVMGKPRLEVVAARGLLEKVVINSDIDFLSDERFKLGYAGLLRVDLLADTPDSLSFKFYTGSGIHTKTFLLKDF